MLNGCYHQVVSLYSQTMIEFTVTLHNTEARKCYLTICSATFTVDKDGFQMD